MSTALFDPIKVMSKITDTVLVAFSGGKDSIVTLDLCMKYFKHVEVFFEYLVPNLGYQEKLLNWYENKYDINIVRLPCEDISFMFHYGVYRNLDLSYPIISQTDIYNYMRLKTGIPWVANGERINDSLERRAKIKHSGTIDPKQRKFYPVANFTNREIYDYIKFHKLYLDAAQKERGHSLSLYGTKDLTYVKNHFPSDFEKICRLYPYIEVVLKHYESYEKEKNNHGENKIPEL